MSRFLKIIVPAFATSALLSACGSSSSTTTNSGNAAPAPSAPATSGVATVKTASNSTLGKTVLVDAHGMTLYRLTGESGTNFICKSSACTSVWHPLVAPSGGSPTGTSSLGTVTRPDGSMQVAYKGEPLYTFASDKAPGDANGQGVKDVGTWEAVSTGGGASSAPAPAPTTSSSSSGGGGYGY